MLPQEVLRCGCHACVLVSMPLRADSRDNLKHNQVNLGITCMQPHRPLSLLLLSCTLAITVSATTSLAADTAWMVQSKYGLFVHYQYRILLGYSIRTKPQFPKPEQM